MGPKKGKGSRGKAGKSSNTPVLEMDDSASIPNVEQEEEMVVSRGSDLNPSTIEDLESGKMSPLFNSSGSVDEEMVNYWSVLTIV